MQEILFLFIYVDYDDIINYLYIFTFQFYCFELKEKDSVWITRVDSRLKMMIIIFRHNKILI